MKALKMVDVLFSMCNLCFIGNRNCRQQLLELPVLSITIHNLIGLSAALGSLSSSVWHRGMR